MDSLPANQIVPQTPPAAELDFEALGGLGNTMTLINATFVALSRNIMSGDLVVLSLLQAADIAASRGVPQDIIDSYLDQMQKAMARGRKSNPLSGLY